MSEELKAKVVQLLVSAHDFSLDEAEEMVETSFDKDTDNTIWHEGSNAEDVAKYLASEDDDE